MNKQTTQKKTPKYREQTNGYQRGGGWRDKQLDEGIKRCEPPVIKQMSQNEMYSMGNIVINILSVVTDSNYTYHVGHFVMYINVESLCYIPETILLNQL